MGYLHLPAFRFQRGVLPAYPCYCHGKLGWDASKYNLFLIKYPNAALPSQEQYQVADIEAFLSGSPECFLIFGNEPDRTPTAGDGVDPETFAQWLKDTCIDTLQANYSFTAIISAISDTSNVTWTPKDGNPYAPSVSGTYSMEAYMWDVLRWFHHYKGSELSGFMQYRNYHVYGGAGSGADDVSGQVRHIFDVIQGWETFFSPDPNVNQYGYDYVYGTDWSSKPVISSETAFDPTLTSEAHRGAFVNQLFNRLRGTEGQNALIEAWCYFDARTESPERKLLNSDNSPTAAGKEYIAVANQARCSSSWC